MWFWQPQEFSPRIRVNWPTTASVQWFANTCIGETKSCERLGGIITRTLYNADFEQNRLKEQRNIVRGQEDDNGEMFYYLVSRALVRLIDVVESFSRREDLSRANEWSQTEDLVGQSNSFLRLITHRCAQSGVAIGIEKSSHVIHSSRVYIRADEREADGKRGRDSAGKDSSNVDR